MSDQITFIGTTLSLTSADELLSAIDHATEDRPVRAATPNPEFMVLAKRNKAFAHALSEMTHCLVDGYGLFLALNLFRARYHQQFQLEHQPGSDFLEKILERYQDGSKRIYLLGGNPGSAERLKDNALSRFPNLKIVGAERGEQLSQTKVEISPEQQRTIETAHPDILILGFGAPKQEFWMQAAQHKLHIPTMIGLGGSFNFYNTAKRAPKVMQKLHLEWLWRGLTTPGHFKRIWTAVVVFPALTLFSFRKRTP